MKKAALAEVQPGDTILYLPGTTAAWTCRLDDCHPTLIGRLVCGSILDIQKRFWVALLAARVGALSVAAHVAGLDPIV